MKTRSRLHLSILAAFTLAFGTAVFAQGAYCDPQWHPQSTTAPPIWRGGIFFDGRQFVVYGSDGTLETSPDGEFWTFGPRIHDFADSRDNWNVYSGLSANGHNALFFGGGGGYPSAFVSADLQHWDNTHPVDRDARVLQAGKYFFALNSGWGDTYIYLSLDAVHWWGIPRAYDQRPSSIFYDEVRRKYFAEPNNGTIGSSPDGINWTWTTSSFGQVYAFASNHERIIAVTGGGTPGEKLIASTDGEVWSEVPAPSELSPMLRSGNGRFVMLGTRASSGADGLLSDDGLHWAEIPRFTESSLVDFAYGAGHWVAKDIDGKLFSSTDGLAWHEVGPDPDMSGLKRVIRAGSPPLFVAISTLGYDPKGGVWISTDGSSWSQAWKCPVGLTDITWGEGRFVVVGEGHFIATSEDGLQWDVRYRDYFQNPQMTGLAYGESMFVAAAWRDGLVYSSPDGINWDAAIVNDLQPGESLLSVSYGAGRFVLSSSTGRLRTSSDGRTWHTTHDGQSIYGSKVIHGDQGFLAGPYDGYPDKSYAMSPDGEAWETIYHAPAGIGGGWYVNGHYVVPSSSFLPGGYWAGSTAVSDDGRTWVTQPASFPGYVSDLIGDGTSLWGVGCTACAPGSYAKSFFFKGEECAPAVTGLSPAQGPMEGGTEVSIAGSSLSDVTAVHFGAKTASSFKVVSDSLVTAVTPAHDNLETDVTVDTPRGKSAEHGLDRFAFQSPFSYFEISAVRWIGPTSKLFINGYGFKNECSIRIDGKPVPKLKLKQIGDNGISAVVTGGAALRAMLPKGRYVLITIDNPGEPNMTALAIFSR